MKTVAILVVAGVLTAGCTYSVEPVGSEPVRIDPEVWQGVWVPAFAKSGDRARVEVVNAESGHLRLSLVADVGGELETHETEAYVRRLRDWTVLSIACPPDECGEQRPFVWARIDIDDDAAVLWYPDTDKIEALVEAGLLPGHQDEYDTILQPLDADHIELFTSEAHGVLLEWDEPIFLRRVERQRELH